MGPLFFALQECLREICNFDPETQIAPLDGTQEGRAKEAIRRHRADLRQTVLDFLKENPGASTRKVRQAVPGRSAQVAGALEKFGDIVWAPGSRNSKLWDLREEPKGASLVPETPRAVPGSRSPRPGNPEPLLRHRFPHAKNP